MEILGTNFDKKLTFKSHIEDLPRRASQKLASFRRISWLLDDKGKELLYKAQTRSTLEYSWLAWGGVNTLTTQLNALEKLPEKSMSIFEERIPGHPINIDSLQRRRHVVGLKTIACQEDGLCAPQEQSVDQAPAAMEEPRCCTAHDQRQFLFSHGKLWNEFIRISKVEAYSLLSIKYKVQVMQNEW
ncbi:uncharacterized protein LOC122246694 [Penaeus japonicus]|uniref:uncharacterized protein LOC122246694 n=1 Tax=Penaeus japonicus TaxID=27405 RepID=UPI001C710F55|nr:uncharacterized protein LOC122246694 [Penaeus japonicus]